VSECERQREKKKEKERGRRREKERERDRGNSLTGVSSSLAQPLPSERGTPQIVLNTFA